MTKTQTILILTNPEPGRALLTKPELAQRLQVAERTIDRYVSKGLIPYLKLPSRVLFDWNQVFSHLSIDAQTMEQNESQWSRIDHD